MSSKCGCGATKAETWDACLRCRDLQDAREEEHERIVTELKNFAEEARRVYLVALDAGYKHSGDKLRIERLSEREHALHDAVKLIEKRPK